MAPRFSARVQTALKPTHPPIEWVPGLSRELSGRGVALTTHPHLTLWLKKEETIPLLPVWALMACSGVNFTVIGTFGLLKYKYPTLVCQYWPKFTAVSLAVGLRCWLCTYSVTEVLLFLSHSSTEVSACDYQPQTVQYCKPVHWRLSYGAYITYLWAVLPTSVCIFYSFMHLEIPFIISYQDSLFTSITSDLRRLWFVKYLIQSMTEVHCYKLTIKQLSVLIAWVRNCEARN